MKRLGILIQGFEKGSITATELALSVLDIVDESNVTDVMLSLPEGGFQRMKLLVEEFYPGARQYRPGMADTLPIPESAVEIVRKWLADHHETRGDLLT